MKKHHSPRTFRHTPCAAAIAALLAGLAAVPAHAQSAAQPPAEAATPAQQNNVVIVSGTRQSVISAIERKKGAATVTDSIVAEDIGQFPDKNMGEALSRITGVQLTRDFGEGNQVSIRGVEPSLNRVEVNGMSTLSTSSSRGADLRELPAELIKSIDVYKGITADITEGGVGGTVSIKTNKPLDFKKLTIATTLSGEQGSLRGGVQPRGSLLIADRFMNGNLGLMANLVYDKVYTQGDFLRNTGFRFLRDWDFSPEKTVTSLNPAAAAVSTKAGCAALGVNDRAACEKQWYDYTVSTPRYGTWMRDHKRKSGEFTAQYKFSNEFNAWVTWQRNDNDQMQNDRNYGTDFPDVNRLANAGAAPVYNANGTVASAGTCLPVSTTGTPAGMVVRNHVVTEYTAGSCQALSGYGGYNAFSTASRDFAVVSSSDYRSAGFTWRKGQWDAEGLIARSKADQTNDYRNLILYQNAPGLKVTMDDRGLPRFTFPQGWSPDDAASYTRAELQYRPTASDSGEDQLKLDLRYRPTIPFFTKIWTGVQGRNSKTKQFGGGGYLIDNGANLASTADDLDVRTANVNQILNYDPLNPNGAVRPAIAQSFINSSFSEKWITGAQMRQIVDAVRANMSGFLSGSGLSGYPSGWMYPSTDAALGYFDTSNFNQQYVRMAPGRDGKLYPQIPVYDVEERIRAAYLRADFEQDVLGYTIEGNVGVRYAGTRTRTTGMQQYRQRVGRDATSAAYDDRIISNAIVTKENKYHDYLPSFNAATWVLPDTLVVRLGWGKVMSRPAIDRLAPAINCLENSGLGRFGGDGTDDCTAGNPDLKPYRATNTDVSVEWYPNQDSQVSLAYFQKDIKTSILPNVVVRQDIFGTGKVWDVTTAVNHEGATTKGFELAGRTALTFLPGVLNGLGVDANYTRMTYEYAPGTALVNQLDGTELTYPGLSKNSYNAAIWYDKYDINARLAYNYRDKYFTGSTDSATGNPTYLSKAGYLDAKIQYRITPNLSVAIEGKNLTDEVIYNTAGADTRVNEVQWYGRRYFVSLSYKY